MRQSLLVAETKIETVRGSKFFINTTLRTRMELELAKKLSQLLITIVVIDQRKKHS